MVQSMNLIDHTWTLIFRSSGLFPCYSESDDNKMLHMSKYMYSSDSKLENNNFKTGIEDYLEDDHYVSSDSSSSIFCHRNLESKDDKILVFLGDTHSIRNISVENPDVFMEGV